MVKPIHEHYDDLMKGRISRRDFLRRTATAGAATPLIVNYLNSPESAFAAPRKHFSLTRAMAQDGAKLTAPAAGVDTSEQLVFRGWNYRPEVVQDNTSKFNAAYNETADYQTIT